MIKYRTDRIAESERGTNVPGLCQAITDMLNDSEKAGEKRLAQLCDRLMDVGRLEDIKQTFTNRELRESLYEKFGIRK